MSELGTIERKSLVARFDTENIVKVATSPDDPERLFITMLDSKGKEFTVPVSLADDALSFPLMHMTVINNTGDDLTFQQQYNLAQYGLSIEPVTVADGATEEVTTMYEYSPNITPAEGRYAAYIGVAESVTATYSDKVNCDEVEASFAVITDPFADSSITITFS